MNVLIYALTIKRGGALKVLESFLETVTNEKRENVNYVIILSIKLKIRFSNSPLHIEYFDHDNPTGIYRFIISKRIHKLIDKFQINLVYTIGAPSYYKFNVPQVVRLTEPYVLHPNKHAYSRYGLIDYCTIKLKTYIKFLAIKNEIYFETQTQYAKNRILNYINPLSKVLVVNNTISLEIFNNHNKFDIRNEQVFRNDKIKILCMAYPYPHKDILGSLLVASIIKEVYRNFIIYYTIPKDSKKFLKQFYINVIRLGLNDNVVNLGEVQQNDLSNIYRRIDIVYQSSLLETSSSTLIEGLYFDKLILCAKLPYNIEICKDSAFYFEPLNYSQNADMLFKLINNLDLHRNRIDKRIFVSNPVDNYNVILKYFKEILDGGTVE
jgi:glycosyltransferase involved in cell wall biosynthesis